MRHEPTAFPSPLAEKKSLLSVSSKLSVFFIQLRWAEKAKILASNTPLPGKEIKLFFSISPQILSLRFDSAPAYREQAFGINTESVILI